MDLDTNYKITKYLDENKIIVLENNNFIYFNIKKCFYVLLFTLFLIIIFNQIYFIYKKIILLLNEIKEIKNNFKNVFLDNCNKDNKKLITKIYDLENKIIVNDNKNKNMLENNIKENNFLLEEINKIKSNLQNNEKKINENKIYNDKNIKSILKNNDKENNLLLMEIDKIKSRLEINENLEKENYEDIIKNDNKIENILENSIKENNFLLEEINKIKSNLQNSEKKIDEKEINLLLSEITEGYPEKTTLNNQRDLIIKLLQSNGLFLAFLPEKYHFDNELIHVAVKSNPFCLLKLFEKFVQNNSNSLPYEQKRLCFEQTVGFNTALDAVKKDGRIIDWFLHNCKGFINKDLVLEACKNYPQAVKHILVDINSILRNNIKFENYNIKDHHEAFNFAKDCIRRNICCSLFIKIPEINSNYELNKLALESYDQYNLNKKSYNDGYENYKNEIDKSEIKFNHIRCNLSFLNT